MSISSPAFLAMLILVAGTGGDAGTRIEKDNVALAKKELAGRLKVAEEAFEVEKVEAVEWRDRSLGCPRKGTTYSPVITPGHLVVLRVERDSYRLHVGGGRAIVCSRRRPEATRPSAERSGKVIELLQMARADLAQKLEVPEPVIRVVGMTPKTWPDASLGCPQPEGAYAEVLTEGFLIELEANERRFRYHTDLERIVACDRPEPLEAESE